MRHSIELMKDSIISILKENVLAIYLYGSVSIDDFKLGWSDIDILCITNQLISDDEAEQLVTLRQRLLKEDENNKYFRSFEGAIVSLIELQNNDYTKVVYWGTSGQKVTSNYYFDYFSQYELIKFGLLLYGTDIRGTLQMPSYNQLREEVIKHYNVIRNYAIKTDGSLHSCGWLLDIARGIYTLRTGEIIAKTKAGQWALNEEICPVEKDLIKTLELRNNPFKYQNQEDIKSWLASLGLAIQQFADILEDEIEHTK